MAVRYGVFLGTHDFPLLEHSARGAVTAMIILPHASHAGGYESDVILTQSAPLYRPYQVPSLQVTSSDRFLEFGARTAPVATSTAPIT
ncbi:MAG: hypothetical protein CM1200mP18_07650 [Gammaproteobacteria bacterium]|nr:MAG: hypothetical protein CM1200mP18_07650 [Gammaproteobacteria bacterium]